jgi:hypothetical protein
MRRSIGARSLTTKSQSASRLCSTTWVAMTKRLLRRCTGVLSFAKQGQYLAFGVRRRSRKAKRAWKRVSLPAGSLPPNICVGFQGIGYRITNPADAFSSGERCLDGRHDLRLVTQVIDGDGTLYVTAGGDDGRIRTIGARAMPGSDQGVRDLQRPPVGASLRQPTANARNSARFIRCVSVAESRMALPPARA